ncbi:unnamed protein product [Miscanthus lutarioriparius]|uniref:Uncharacterized protein n=1 Tax=Miscanthus lutarioriparius TaxID=422564 RepID=A0A811S6W5_9POAL|nr:unnamed protein product [Miscanthus lutarioriparius]
MAAMAASSRSVCMIGGDGETSYANNSHFQSRLKPLVEEAIATLCRAAVPGRVGVADLGCSSGPNSLSLVSTAVDSLRCHHRLLGCQSRPEVSVYLNDLPDNDFNLVFKAVPAFLEKHMGAGGDHGDRPLVLVFGAPGSFYWRLFAAQTLHLVCSSFSVHWLSKVPQELADGVLVNKGNTWAGRTSTLAVGAAYTRQFEHDFRLFLSSRAEEIVPGGWLVLSLAGRPGKDLSSQDRQSEFTAEVLCDMAARGLVAAEDVDAYNVPFYAPCADELRAAAELEGSFEAVRLESHGVLTCDADPAKSAAMARSLRVLSESTLVRHFGRVDDDVGDEFARAAEARYRGPPAPLMKGVVHVLSLRRK